MGTRDSICSNLIILYERLKKMDIAAMMKADNVLWVRIGYGFKYEKAIPK
jgi:hypothetical protein